MREDHGLSAATTDGSLFVAGTVPCAASLKHSLTRNKYSYDHGLAAERSLPATLLIRYPDSARPERASR
jgi:hypothetical protein